MHGFTFWLPYKVCMHVNVSQLINKICSAQQACSKLVNKLYNNAVILSSCYKVVLHNLLTNCWIAWRWDFGQLVTSLLSSTTYLVASCLLTSRWQLVNTLRTSSANTSCWQGVGTSLLHVCYRFVTTGACIIIL
jgi:hypothetical protein